jgi:hypothetical protein
LELDDVHGVATEAGEKLEPITAAARIKRV